MFSNSVSSHLYFGGSLIICFSTRFLKKSSFSFSTKSFEISHSTLIFCTIYITGNFEIETPKCEKKDKFIGHIFLTTMLCCTFGNFHWKYFCTYFRKTRDKISRFLFTLSVLLQKKIPCGKKNWQTKFSIKKSITR